MARSLLVFLLLVLRGVLPLSHNPFLFTPLSLRSLSSKFMNSRSRLYSSHKSREYDNKWKECPKTSKDTTSCLPEISTSRRRKIVVSYPQRKEEDTINNDLKSSRILASPEVSSSDGRSQSKSLVAAFGENTPKISPLLVLPLSRRPVFPGFFATHLVKDEKTLEAIIENKKKGMSFLGLFLQKKQNRPQSKVSLKNSQEGIITDLDQVHPTGTYCQIHNVIRTARVSDHIPDNNIVSEA